MPNLPDILKARRSELGLTLLQIAEATGVKEATVQRWESGNIKSLRHENLEKLSRGRWFKSSHSDHKVRTNGQKDHLSVLFSCPHFLEIELKCLLLHIYCTCDA